MSNVQQRMARRALAGWEHWQVDLEIDLGVDGMTQLHCFERLQLSLFGQHSEGALVDLILTDQTEEEIIAQSASINVLSSGEAGPAPLSRSWRVSGRGIAIHAHLSVDENGIGFADIFASGED